MKDARDRLIIALDFPDVHSASDLVRQVAPLGVAFKVGLELYVAEGPSVLDALRAAGAERFFLDLKFHDIPNTMAGAVRSAAKLGVWMLNVHASAGSVALRQSVEAAGEASSASGLPRPLVIAVTVLTSIDSATLQNELGCVRPAEQQAPAFARLTHQCGLDGVVAPAPDAAEIHRLCGCDFLVVSPGIRPAGADVQDQARVNTPAAAIAGGSTHLVVGRPVTKAADPAEACARILQEMSSAL